MLVFSIGKKGNLRFSISIFTSTTIFSSTYFCLREYLRSYLYLHSHLYLHFHLYSHFLHLLVHPTVGRSDWWCSSSLSHQVQLILSKSSAWLKKVILLKFLNRWLQANVARWCLASVNHAKFSTVSTVWLLRLFKNHSEEINFSRRNIYEYFFIAFFGPAPLFVN